jgi:hypothetical protein
VAQSHVSDAYEHGLAVGEDHGEAVWYLEASTGLAGDCGPRLAARPSDEPGEPPEIRPVSEAGRDRK